MIFPLLIFEHQYLAYYYICMHKLLHMFRKHSYLGKHVSDFLFKSSFLFYDKKRVTLVIFFLIFVKFQLLHTIKQKLRPKSKI